MKKRLGFLSLAPAMLLLGGMTASAQVVTVNIINPLDPGLGTVYGDKLSYSFNGSASQGLYYAGVFNTNIVLNNQTSSNFDSYCIDLFHDFNGPITKWTAQTATDFNKGGNSDASNPGVIGIGPALAYLVDTYDPTVTSTSITASQQKLNAAALQIALWSVEYNGLVKTDSDSNGMFQSTNGHFYFGDGNGTDTQSQVYALANADIVATAAALAALGTSTDTANFFLSNRDGTDSNGNPAGSQDLIAGSGTVNLLATVPEPSSIAMIAIGLGLVALRARKARRDA